MMNKLLRRFSSTDLMDKDDAPNSLTSNTDTNAATNNQNRVMQTPSLPLNQPNMMPKKNISPSAPSSPTQSKISFNQISTMMTAAREILSSTTTSQQSSKPGLFSQSTLTNKAKVLFVIGDTSVDWSRYFRNRKLVDFEIRVEQAEFKEINMSAYTDSGVMIDILVERNGSKMIKSFKPDFLLIREHPKNIDKDWRHLLIGLKYGGVPSLNSLESIYNFNDKPWVVSIASKQILGTIRF